MLSKLYLTEATKIDLTKQQIVIGASIRCNYSKNLYNFINLNKDILEEKNNVFFSKCGSEKT